MTALSDTLAKARAEGRAALVGYLPAGFPTLAGGIDALTAMVDGGVDVVEVGLPYSDPMLDGPTIQDAVDVALRGGATPRDVLTTVEAVAATGTPTLVMSYYNPIDHIGPARFAADLAAAGGAGVILPDLPPEESGDWLAAADPLGLDSVFLVAPSSSDERIALTTSVCRGFVYAASLMGVTGVRGAVSGAARGLVARTRVATGLPVCVGLGVSTAEQATEVAGYADGVIVGSAFVRELLDAASPADGAAAVHALAGELAAGVRRGAGERAGTAQ
ncbi:tryptophan synthase subunit alpha [Motilibacter sp. K478]|nr:tryptophan synthase subunit alpha [Motilibacter aurantiacus]